MSSPADEAFKSSLAKIGGIIEGAFVRNGLEIGRRLGLFTAIASFNEPKSCHEIAEHTHLKERYIREWLGAMVTSGVISLDASGNKYYIKEPMARVLASPLLQWARAVSDLDVLDDLIECFKSNGPNGLPYSRYTKFTDWIAAYKDEKLFDEVTSNFVQFVPGLQQKLGTGVTVCDMGCGSGLVTRLLAKAFPNSNFVGFDISEETIGRANSDAESEGVSNNCKYFVHNAVKLPEEWSGRFDIVLACDTVHDQGRPDLGLLECYRVLKAGGELIVQDGKGHTEHRDNVEEKEFVYSNPAFSPALFYMVSLMHCVPVSLHCDGGMGLGAMWGKEKAISMFHEAGFADVQALETPYDPANIVYICKK